MNQPLIQTPPASQTFLTSAANIMMGVGLTGNRNQEPRYDAYKNMSSGNVRRYWDIVLGFQWTAISKHCWFVFIKATLHYECN